MLTQLKFKNWRSLKDETIDFTTPITVFIGANSSGKTNILDALYFWRSTMEEGIVQTVYSWGGRHKIRTSSAREKDSVELSLSYSMPQMSTLTNSISLQFKDRDVPFLFGRRFLEGKKVLFDNSPVELPAREIIGDVKAFWAESDFLKDQQHNEITLKNFHLFIKDRWQMLDENFMPPLSLSSRVSGDIYAMDRCGDNLLFMLDFMQQTRPDLYDELMFDFRWMLGHVESASVNRDDRETRLLLTEKSAPEREAPSVSAGTARLLAMLTAYYALDMRYAEMPGLVVIEEPDTALNPWVVEKFVEQLRNYVDREHPRQFILTTHNPRMLDFFEPEEVRVVERDEEGYTTVKPIPDYIKDIWLKDGEYSLGEVWLTNSFGGVLG